MIKYKKILGVTNSEDILENATIEQLENKFLEWETLNN